MFRNRHLNDFLFERNSILCLCLTRDDILPSDVTASELINIVLPYLQNHREVNGLDLKGQSRMGDVAAYALENFLEDNSTLYYLSLRSCGITGAGVTALSAMLEHNTTLRGLDLGSAEFGEGALKALSAALKKNTTLVSFGLDYCHLGDVVTSALANTNLKTISLIMNDITNQGAEELAKNQSFRHVDLSGNQIADVGVMRLAENKIFKELRLFQNPFGDEGVLGLARNTTLESLDLRGYDISENGMKALVSNITLKKLNLNIIRGIELKKETKQVFEETNPVKRANYGIEVGIIPSLKRLAMFKVKEHEIDISKLLNDPQLQDGIKKFKV